MRLCRDAIPRRQTLPEGRQGGISTIDSFEILRFFPEFTLSQTETLRFAQLTGPACLRSLKSVFVRRGAAPAKAGVTGREGIGFRSTASRHDDTIL